MALPGLSQYFGKAAKKQLQSQKTDQSAPQKPVSSTHSVAVNRVLNRQNRTSAQPSILKATGDNFTPQEKSIRFNPNVTTHRVFYGSAGKLDVTMKGTMPLAASKLNAPGLN